MIGLAVLGSTGSIGASTLDVAARHQQRYRVVALTANRDLDGMFAQCQAFQPRYAVMADREQARKLAKRIEQAALPVQVLAGREAIEQVAALPEVDQVMAAIVGAAGLLPTLSAVRAGKRVLLANKETLVMAGRLFMREAERSGSEILPIDSEHNAVFQCLPTGFEDGPGSVGVRRILLTASGGPFRSLPLEALSQVTPEQACAHPNWDMGRKISVDSATMMNKGLEVIEACWLFHTQAEQIEVVLHPQSVIHSMVEYTDGSVLAQLGNPDMRTPIAHAMAWPERMESGVDSLDLCRVGRLEFEPPDLQRFPCLRLAYQAIDQAGSTPAVLNAANEIAVAAFLAGQLPFMAIPETIERTLVEMSGSATATDIDTLLQVDAEARARAEQIAARLV